MEGKGGGRKLLGGGFDIIFCTYVGIPREEDEKAWLMGGGVRRRSRKP
jgi:hypothetical protein